MSIKSSMALLQLFVRIIFKDPSFRDRWTCISSLEKVLTSRYKYDSSIFISKMTISQAIGKMDPNIDDQNMRHLSGIYRGKVKSDMFYFFQDPEIDPPTFPSPQDSNAWEKIIHVDKKEVDDFMNCMNIIFQIQISKKRGS